MNKGQVDLDSLKVNKAMAIFRGKSAYCFLLEDKIIKVYADTNDIHYTHLKRDLIEDFSKYKSKTIVFPLEYLYENNQIAGEISKYIENKSLLNNAFNAQTKINPIIRNYLLAVNEIKKFLNIDMIDIDPVNILYSGKQGFHIIDVTEWRYSNDSAKANVFRFDSALFYSICYFIEFPRFYHDFIKTKMTYNILSNKFNYGALGNEFYELIECNLMGDYHIIEFLEAYKAMYKIYYDNEMKTLGNMKKYTKILKKG